MRKPNLEIFFKHTGITFVLEQVEDEIAVVVHE
jgi:hypothetical protein